MADLVKMHLIMKCGICVLKRNKCIANHLLHTEYFCMPSCTFVYMRHVVQYEYRYCLYVVSYKTRTACIDGRESATLSDARACTMLICTRSVRLSAAEC